MYNQNPSIVLTHAENKKVPAAPKTRKPDRKEMLTTKLAAQFALVVIEVATPLQDEGNISLQIVQGLEPSPGEKTSR